MYYPFIEMSQTTKQPQSPRSTSSSTMPELPKNFFYNIMEAQKNYYKNGDEQSMKKLLAFYSDCVYYFDLKQQNISEYFQNKIKNVVKDVKRFGTQEQAQKNKQKMNEDIVRVMQSYNIKQQITQTDEKQKKLQETVKRITQQQAQNLRKRMLRSKRHLNKTKSVTMSFGSVDSPQVGLTSMKKIEEQFGIDLKNFYFSNDDDDQQ